MTALLIAAALLLLSAGQVLQKRAADSVVPDDKSALLWHLASRPITWWAILCMALGTVAWLFVLYRMDVGQAFPYLSLSNVLVLMASRYWLGETIPVYRWTGVACIIAGITLLSLG